jgi:hypothetical protein
MASNNNTYVDISSAGDAEWWGMKLPSVTLMNRISALARR